MKIEYLNYIMYPEKDRFNLYQKVIRTVEKDTEERKAGETYESEEIIGYSISFEKCMKDIAHFEADKENITVQLGKYVRILTSKYQEILDNIQL